MICDCRREGEEREEKRGGRQEGTGVGRKRKATIQQYTIKNFEAELRDGPFFGIDSLSFHFPI
jgi:hypothetical protein